MRVWIGISALAVWVGSVAACAPSEPPAPEETRPSGPVEWGYEADDGPSVWGELSTDYDLCATGTRQSPVDLITGPSTDLARLTTDYHDSAIELVNNGHTVQADYDAGSGIDLDGRRFVLRQFHFHAPSEHTVEGRSLPAEIHFVHDSPAGEVVVIGALVDAGRRNDALAPVLDNLPTTVDLPRAVIDERVSAAAILGVVGESMRYDGSLTTPPCTEGVRWIVLAEPLQLDEAQIDQIRAVVHENNRPVQPARGRPIASVHAPDQP